VCWFCSNIVYWLVLSSPTQLLGLSLTCLFDNVSVLIADSAAATCVCLQALRCVEVMSLLMKQHLRGLVEEGLQAYLQLWQEYQVEPGGLVAYAGTMPCLQYGRSSSLYPLCYWGGGVSYM
jgi:hypothetical protein